ncbi:MAG: GNAT family N-acetyltransferase [Acidimicrobiia bacterium]
MSKLELFDPHIASEEQLRAVHDLYVETHLERLPDDPPQPFAEIVEEWKHQPSFRQVTRWAVWDGLVALGSSVVSVEHLDQNKDQAWFWAHVRKPHRRGGLGTRLLAPALELAHKEDRPRLATWTWDGSDGEGFISWLGGDRRLSDRTSRAWVKDVDADLMRMWVERAPERASDYELVSWEGPVSDDLLQAYIDVLDVMNTAPREDFEEEDWHWTPEQLRDWENAAIERGLTWWVMSARHQPTGELVGVTNIFFPPHRPYRADQGDTGVDPEHRNKGLGRWLKAAMFLKLIEEKPEVDRIDTDNADSNEPMLAINTEMGFRPLITSAVWQVPLEKAEAALAGRG